MNVSKATQNAIDTYAKKRFPNPFSASSTEQANQPTSFQDQTQTGSDKSGGPAPYKSRILQTINPEPVRDTQEEDRLKKIAGVNAIGRILGSFGQLGGMASGGDAVYIEDTLSPQILDKLAFLDNDYRNNLRDWSNQAFSTERFNAEQQNRDIQDENNRQFRFDQIDAQGQKEREMADYRAKIALEQFNRKTDADKRQDMISAGINPDDPDAEQKFIKRMNESFGVNTNYRRSLTAENWANANRMNNPTESKSKSELDLKQIEKGVNSIVADLEKRRKNIPDNLRSTEREAYLKDIDEEIKFWTRQYNPKTNELLNERVLNAAGGSAEQQPSNFDSGQPYTPGQGMTIDFQGNPQNQPQPTDRPQLSEKEIMAGMRSNQQKVISNAASINSLDLNNPDPKTAQMVIDLAQELLDLGITQDQDEAVQWVIQLAKENSK